jgi:hypothetical protein
VKNIMLRLVADENLTNGIVRGLLRFDATIDIVRVQDVGLSGASDSVVFDWAATHHRVLVTHDYRTVPHYARRRMDADLEMFGVFIVPYSLSIRQAIDDLLLLTQCSMEADWKNMVLYLPL